MVRERLRVRHYSRCMDDCVLLHHDRDCLRHCLEAMTRHLQEDLGMEFNAKTQIFPLKNGVGYLGWHFYLSGTGKVVRRLRPSARVRFRRRLQYLRRGYEKRLVSLQAISLSMAAMCAHLAHGHAHGLAERALASFILR